MLPGDPNAKRQTKNFLMFKKITFEHQLKLSACLIGPHNPQATCKVTTFLTENSKCWMTAGHGDLA